MNIGTLLAFVLVCIGVWILRRKRPDLDRPFRTPLVPLVPILGVLACLGLMATLPGDTWLRLLVWLLIGFVIYFGYGRKHSRAAAGAGRRPRRMRESRPDEGSMDLFRRKSVTALQAEAAATTASNGRWGR